MNKILNINIFYLYEITLKVKSIGIKQVLSSSSPYIYPCPTTIYLNNDLVQDITDCHYINIKESDSEIKLEWNNINIVSTKGLFYNCAQITEIDMTKFDTSLVTDMAEMFLMCSSLKSLNVNNLNTTKVTTFENMFFRCTSLASINLESFTNPSATSLYRMFYDCINLEYINIKNFEEKENINLNEMFYNIPQKAVICSLTCPPPTNFIISSMSETQAEISWEGYEWNKFIISYGLQTLVDPETGTKINVTDKAYYTFTNLIPNKRYDIYIKTDCSSKSSYWIGPLMVSIETYNMAKTGTNSITTCPKVIYDSGGPNGDYENWSNSILTIKPHGSGKFLSIKGTVYTELDCDYLYIYNGEGTHGPLLGKYDGVQTMPLLMSTTGSLTIKFTSNLGILDSGFQLTVCCIINSPQTIYNLIKENNCRLISCDRHYRNKQNKI